MSTRLPGNLAEVFPLRFRLREELRFFRAGDLVVAERVRSGQRYSLKSWQHAMLMRFDGRRTYEEAAREVYRDRPASFTAKGLLNFYNWLYNENLILCECESIFELVLGDGDRDIPHHPGLKPASHTEEEDFADFAGRLLGRPLVKRGLATAVGVVFCLSVIRLVYVAAPVFEPPVQRVYAEAREYLERGAPARSHAESERTIAEGGIEPVSLAARMPEAPQTPPDYHVSPEVAPVPAVTAPKAAIPTPPKERVSDEFARIETLRTQLEECRIRRDEFYLQGDEEGYRREVHRMTNLAREIGDIEKGL